MEFDKWFNKQSLLLKVILMLPAISWITEILVRLSVVLRTKELIDVVLFIAFVFGGLVFGIIDFVYLLLKEHLFMVE